MKKALLIVCAMLGMSSPAAAEDGGWWNKDWGFRKGVVVDTTASGVNISGPIGRTVVLVRLHSGNFGFADALQNGADIRFVDSDGKTPLPFHIEQYDAATGIATVWVSVPNLNGGEKHKIWLYFGNKSAPVGADAAGTFDPDYMAVYHFGQNPGQPVNDATANANATQNPPAGLDDGGIIGRAVRFPGQGALQIAPSGSMAMPAGAPFTFSAWVKPDNLAGQQAVFSRGTVTIGINAGVAYVQAGGQLVAGKTPLKQGDWSNLAVTDDGQNLHLYVNGVEDAAAAMALPAMDGPTLVGGATGAPFTGELDEVRLSKTARPAGMLMAMAQAEGPGGKLVAVDESAEKPSAGSGVLGFIVSKLEPVDAVIIGLCMILLASAISLMIAKVRYLNKSVRGNKVFLKRFRDMHEELRPIAMIDGISPAEVAYIHGSPLGRLYQEGLEELDVRRKRGRQSLSSEAVEAMRAAVDAIVVHENQKLDKLMVILTIAISGGPFIGLLGTVIGVMTVFGGVAMAGDVNVNAIAPGIAAALLATIAGLACAIPSLFGYNYLNGRISMLADEMRVFVDRLITRLAEIAADEADPLPPLAVAAE